MIKLVSSALLVFLALSVTPSAAANTPDGDTVVSRSPQLSLDIDAYRQLLSGRKTAELRSLAGSQDALLDRVLDLHSNRVLEKEAEGLELDQDPEVSLRLAEARQRILVAALMQRVRERVEMPDLAALAKERYALRKHEFVTEERRQVAHILLRDVSNCPCDKTPPAEQRIAKLREALLAGQVSFEDAAKQQSLDTNTAQQGGVIPQWVQRDGQTVRAFEDAVFALTKVGEIGPPLVTRYGVHLVKLLAIEPVRQLSFEEVEQQITQQLQRELVASALEKQRSMAYPDPATVNLGALSALVDELIDTAR